ncbi:hypothetical protein MEME101129_21945 [Methylobacterium mesophilicum]|uniref:hypothetical protein n=1 Tax=Methylobacterium mesophilicum TaxID=39956 RepID=UPI003610AE6A
MALLPPPDHIPVSVASVYLIAQILAAETNRTGAEGECPSFLKTGNRPYAVLRSTNPDPDPDPEVEDDTETFELTATKVEILKAQYRPDDYFSANGVRIAFVSKSGKPFYKRLGVGYPAPDVLNIALDLRPPYQTCLNGDRVKENLNRHSLSRLVASSMPERFGLVLPAAVASSAGLALRQAFAAGGMEALMIEEDGRETPVPEAFWRTEKADAVLARDALVSMQVDGRTAVGHVFMRASDIRDDWPQILGLAPPKKPDRVLSPYIELAKKVSDELKLTGGHAENDARISWDKVREKVAEWYAHFIPEVNARTEARIDHVTTLIRHPLDENGGFVSGKAAKKKPAVNPQKKLRGARHQQTRQQKKA